MSSCSRTVFSMWNLFARPSWWIASLWGCDSSEEETLDWITGGYTCCRCALQCSRHRLSRRSKVLSVLAKVRKSRVCKQSSAGTLWSPLVTVFKPRLKHPDGGVRCSNSVNSKHLILIEMSLPAMLVRTITCVLDPPCVMPNSACHSQHSSVMTGTGACLFPAVLLIMCKLIAGMCVTRM